ncbi:Rv3654c family TadE-like protein [Phytoactinopolyspora limicola]|uniref:Rv3654c family TadE-like protein n=1 Tax=Phytoactinopolyspora limicola TaxID=2715536 RepID=UPI001409F924|nr:Rv3654c family TadE-like protein [Phytoactinopolyspora limicola]
MSGGRGQRGAGSVLVLLVVGVVIVVLAAVAVMASGIAARRQAALAADLAALAGAQRVPDEAAACATAEAVARANDAVVQDCVIDGAEIEVLVRVVVSGPGAGWIPAQERRARAGPG